MILIGEGLLLMRRVVQPRMQVQGCNSDLFILTLHYFQLQILGLLTIPISAA